jgi:hypothetical protein
VTNHTKIMIEKFFETTSRFARLCVLGVSAFLGLTAEAQLTNINYPNYQSGQPNFFYADTNYNFYALTNGFTTNSITPGLTGGATNTYIKTIRQNQGLSLFASLWMSNGIAQSGTGPTNYTFFFNVTGDGSTWTTGKGPPGYPLSWTISLIGMQNTTNTYWTNIPISTMSNVRKIQCTCVVNSSSNFIGAALGYSQSTQ